MKRTSQFKMIGKMEVEVNGEEIISIRYKEMFFRTGDFVVCNKRVRGFAEGTRGIVTKLRKPKHIRDLCIEVHFEHHPYSYTMRLCEIRTQ